MKYKYMNEALKQAKKAYKKGDVPIGTIIVKDNKIIAKAYNKKEKNKIATSHAEIIAINKACKKLRTWHLENCILYTTMEPCMMCTGAILQSRIENICYGISNKSFGAIHNLKKNNKISIEGHILEKECLELVQKFFRNKRK